MNQNTSSIVPVIQEAERTLAAAITHFGLTVKPEQICLTVQSKGRKQALGWFAPGYWSKGANVSGKGKNAKRDDKSVHEINLSAEHLRTCDVGELIIHELAHAENEVLGIRDCANRVHNKKFKTMAERLGLKVLPRDSAVGFGFTELDEPAKKFLESISFKRDLFDAARIGGGGRKKGSVGSRLLKCECGECGYVARTTQKWLDEVGAPLCPCNHAAMEVA
jgi:hypothetical protein